MTGYTSGYTSDSEYARVQNTPGLHRVLNIPEYAWINPEYTWLSLNKCEYAWICSNNTESAWMAFVLHFSIVIPCLKEP